MVHEQFLLVTCIFSEETHLTQVGIEKKKNAGESAKEYSDLAQPYTHKYIAYIQVTTKLCYHVPVQNNQSTNSTPQERYDQATLQLPLILPLLPVSTPTDPIFTMAAAKSLWNVAGSLA